jgi:hypothetical protein
MTDTVQLALIALAGAVVAAVPPSIIAWKAKASADEATKKTVEGNQRIQQLEIRVDGRLTQLLEAKEKAIVATAASSEAKGVLKEKERADLETRIRKEK